MTTFAGFTKDTPRFLRALGKNNDKAWFDAHRADYEAHYLEPAKALVVAIGEQLVKIAPNVNFEPRVNGSIFKINRDVRFAKDKTPYKDHIDMRFWEGPDRKTAISGFYLRIRADGIDLGAGAHGFEKQTLAAYRAVLTHEKTAASLEKIVAKIERSGTAVSGEHYKKLPRGVEPSSEMRDRLARHNALWAGGGEKFPDAFYSGAFVKHCVARYKKLLPIHRFLVDEVQ